MEADIYAPPKANLEHGGDAGPALWNPNAAANWSLLFSPVFGSILLWRNCIAIGDKVARAKTWLAVSIVMVIVQAVLFPGIALLYLIIWYFAWARPQARYVRYRWGKTYPRKPWGIPLGIAFPIWLVLVGIVVVMTVLTVNQRDGG